MKTRPCSHYLRTIYELNTNFIRFFGGHTLFMTYVILQFPYNCSGFFLQIDANLHKDQQMNKTSCIHIEIF